MEDELMLFTKLVGERPIEYGYGPEWVGMAMYMDDFPKFYTEEDAKEYWLTVLSKEQYESDGY